MQNQQITFFYNKTLNFSIYKTLLVKKNAIFYFCYMFKYAYSKFSFYGIRLSSLNASSLFQLSTINQLDILTFIQSLQKSLKHSKNIKFNLTFYFNTINKFIIQNTKSFSSLLFKLGCYTQGYVGLFSSLYKLRTTIGQFLVPRTNSFILLICKFVICAQLNYFYYLKFFNITVLNALINEMAKLKWLSIFLVT